MMSDNQHRLFKILDDGIAQGMIKSGYTPDFVQWVYEYTDRFNPFHDDIEWILDAMKNGISENEIRKQADER